MMTTATQCIAGCVQCPSEESEVENLPVEIKDMGWLTASQQRKDRYSHAYEAYTAEPMQH